MFPVLSISAVGHDNAQRVVKLQNHTIGTHGLELKSGNSWCADAGCSLLATCYHVAREVRPGKIGGAKVLKTYMASGPDDDGAAWMITTYGKWLRYNPLNDVALIALSRPLFPGTAPPSFYVGGLELGQELVVNGAPVGGKQEAVAARLLGVSDGLLRLSLATETPAGLSGSAVTDKQGRIVGMLSAVTDGSVFAVPLWSIADAIRRFSPTLHSQLFPDSLRKPSEFQGSMVIGRELLAALGGSTPTSALPIAFLEDGLGQPFGELAPPPVRLLNTREEPVDVVKLRHQAQQMFEQMANFRALQTLRLNTEGKSDLTWFHELYVDSGEVVFRSIDDEQPMRDVALPHRRAVVPGGEWRDLLQMVAGQFKLPIKEIGTKDVGGKRLRVFRYQASVEDQVCWLRFRTSRVFWSRERRFPVACRGDVWADTELNPLRISQELEVPAGKAPMPHLQLAVLYGWLGRDLVPAEMVVVGTIAGHACRTNAHFSNYRQVKTAEETLPDGDDPSIAERTATTVLATKSTRALP